MLAFAVLQLISQVLIYYYGYLIISQVSLRKKTRHSYWGIVLCKQFLRIRVIVDGYIMKNELCRRTYTYHHANKSAFYLNNLEHMAVHMSIYKQLIFFLQKCSFLIYLAQYIRVHICSMHMHAFIISCMYM